MIAGHGKCKMRGCGLIEGNPPRLPMGEGVSGVPVVQASPLP